ncbi:MAG: hypothetical protein ACI80V_001549 [Rhodothermales bacterium]|jgi:hypothetical protein
MGDGITRFQVLSLVAAGVAIIAVVLLVREQAGGGNGKPAPEPPGVVSEGEGAPAQERAVDPALDFVRRVSDASDLLHDEAEGLVEWILAAEDTSGLGVRATALDQHATEAIEEMEFGGGTVSLEQVDLLVSLFLDYMDASALALEPKEIRGQLARDYLSRLAESRAEIEGQLLAQLGLF